MAYKLYVNNLLFQTTKNDIIINKGSITIGGVTYEFNNSDVKDLSEVILAYVDQLIDNTPSYQPAWNAEGTKYKWNYIDGVFMNAIINLYKDTGEDKYKTFFLKYIDYYIDADGVFQKADATSTKAPASDAYSISELDSVCASKILFDAYQLSGDRRYLTALEYTYTTMMSTTNIPITSNGINFSHKSSYSDQIWCDGTYMYMPF